MKQIWFDMDGTIANLYSVPNWLSGLRAEAQWPYLNATPMGNFSQLAKLLHKAQAQGWKIGIISWTSKGGSKSYNMAVETAKRLWLNQHLPSVHWDAINIVEYGTNKHNVCGGGILFDDEEGNRTAWGKGAFHPDDMITILKELVTS